MKFYRHHVCNNSYMQCSEVDVLVTLPANRPRSCPMIKQKQRMFFVPRPTITKLCDCISIVCFYMSVEKPLLHKVKITYSELYK